jgi:glycosyltransferase involved in cell wall biosynthesis
MKAHQAPAARLSIGILTKNEERLIEQCVRSALFADEVVVLDSGSTDSTIKIAGSLGARVEVNTDWQGFAVQRNRLLAMTAGDYIFFLDADEVITPALQEELMSIVQSKEQALWSIRWQLIAFGKPLRHFRSSSSMARLFHRQVLDHFDGIVHEGPILKSGVEAQHHMLTNRLPHHSRQSVRASLEKLTQYAVLGAAKRQEAGARGGVIRGLFSALPVFVRTYFFRGAVLDGGPGFLYALFVALEFFFRYVALEYDSEQLNARISR